MKTSHAIVFLVVPTVLADTADEGCPPSFRGSGSSTFSGQCTSLSTFSACCAEPACDYDSSSSTGGCFNMQTTPSPTSAPTLTLADLPQTGFPTMYPTSTPTSFPTTNLPTKSPTSTPTNGPTRSPTSPPTDFPTKSPTSTPTNGPTRSPTSPPTNFPTMYPTSAPTSFSTTSLPTSPPTNFPTIFPTSVPTSVSTTNLPTVPPTLWTTGSPTQTTTPITCPCFSLADVVAEALEATSYTCQLIASTYSGSIDLEEPYPGVLYSTDPNSGRCSTSTDLNTGGVWYESEPASTAEIAACFDIIEYVCGQLDQNQLTDVPTASPAPSFAPCGDCQCPCFSYSDLVETAQISENYNCLAGGIPVDNSYELDLRLFRQTTDYSFSVTYSDGGGAFCSGGDQQVHISTEEYSNCLNDMQSVCSELDQNEHLGSTVCPCYTVDDLVTEGMAASCYECLESNRKSSIVFEGVGTAYVSTRGDFCYTDIAGTAASGLVNVDDYSLTSDGADACTLILATACDELAATAPPTAAPTTQTEEEDDPCEHQWDIFC